MPESHFRPRFQSDEGGHYSAQKVPSYVDNSPLEYASVYNFHPHPNSAQKSQNNQFIFNSGFGQRGKFRSRGMKANVNLQPHRLRFNHEEPSEASNIPMKQYVEYPHYDDQTFNEGCDFIGSEQ